MKTQQDVFAGVKDHLEEMLRRVSKLETNRNSSLMAQEKHIRSLLAKISDHVCCSNPSPKEKVKTAHAK